MYAIVTLMNSDGTFDGVGMNNRAPVSHLTTQGSIMKWAREYARGRTFRIEFYATRHSDKCFKTMVEVVVKPPATPCV